MGGGATIVTSTIDGEYGIGTRNYRTPLKPGDNVRIVVAPRSTGLTKFNPLYSATNVETLGRVYWDSNSSNRYNDGEPVLDENNDINGVHSSPLLTIWRKLHVEVDSMGPPDPMVQYTFGPDDPVPSDIKDPDIAALAPAFRPAFIEIVRLEDISTSALPFTPYFASEAQANGYFNSARQSIEDSMFWSVYIAGVYEFIGDGTRDNDVPPDGADNGPLSGLLGYTGFSGRDHSLISYEILRDVAEQWSWNQNTRDYVERLVVLHEIGHQFRLGHPIEFPSCAMSVPTSDADEMKSPEIDTVFADSDISKVRKDGLHIGQ